MTCRCSSRKYLGLLTVGSSLLEELLRIQLRESFRSEVMFLNAFSVSKMLIGAIKISGSRESLT
jgi:c-di-GMP-binding flagellar brake protein YcgR